jgi:two-component system CheB/CheR fusion protein
MARLQRKIPIKIFATDVDRDAILRAGSGVYPESIVADLPAGLVGKYFTHRDNQYHVSRSLREMVVFAAHNIIKDPPSPTSTC